MFAKYVRAEVCGIHGISMRKLWNKKAPSYFRLVLMIYSFNMADQSPDYVSMPVAIVFVMGRQCLNLS